MKTKSAYRKNWANVTGELKNAGSLYPIIFQSWEVGCDWACLCTLLVVDLPYCLQLTAVWEIRRDSIRPPVASCFYTLPPFAGNPRNEGWIDHIDPSHCSSVWVESNLVDGQPALWSVFLSAWLQFCARIHAAIASWLAFSQSLYQVSIWTCYGIVYGCWNVGRVR